jgi:hypothetical protein
MMFHLSQKTLGDLLWLSVLSASRIMVPLRSSVLHWLDVGPLSF